MPTSTTKTPASPDADLKEYIVLAHAITYRTGKLRGDVARFGRGARLILHSTEQRVKDLVASGSIGIKGERHLRATPASVFKRLGAGDDPASPPLADVLPVKASRAKAVQPSTEDNSAE